MGKKDIITKEYLRQNSIFADVFNYMIFNGEQIIKSEHLVDCDASEIVLPFGKDGALIPVQRYRDLLKGYVIKEYQGKLFALLGIESQSQIHYAMPVKCMLYDTLNYAAQVNMKTNEYRKKRIKKSEGFKESKAEFLSGFHKEDRITPVITVTVYWGMDQWDGPRTLKEMFDQDLFKSEPEVLKWIPEYQIPLIIPSEIEKFEKFQTEFGKMMQFMNSAKDKKKMKELLTTDSAYHSLSRTAAKIINEFTGLNLKITDEGEEKIDLCKAWEDQRKEDIETGIKEGRLDSIKRMLDKGISEEQIKELLDATDVEVAQAKEREE